MALRKKDGNVYVLEGPNPIVKDQVAWDPDGLVFHNFHWEEFIFSKTTRNKPKPPPAEHVVRVDPPKKIEVPPPALAEPIPEVPDEPKKNDPAKEFDLPYIKYKVLCYCLPATTKVHVDKLYGESWQKVAYGKKIIFPCVIINSSDMELEFWTSDPDEKILERSIVYPFSYEVHNADTDSYDRVPYDEYRWWKIASREQKEGGWLLTCFPSETQPDFSD